MGIIDKWAENLFREYNERWYLTSNVTECKKAISNLFDVLSSSRISAYIGRDSCFFPELDGGLRKHGTNRRVIYHDKSLSFIVSDDTILLEKDRQLLIKYHSERLGRGLDRVFNKLYTPQNHKQP